MSNADDQPNSSVPPIPPVPNEPAASASPYAPPAGSPAAQSPQAAPAYSSAQPTYTPNQQNPYQPGVAGPPRGLSITSMVLGIVGVLFGGFGLLISIAAVITGHMGQRRQPYAKPFWLTGIITGYFGILIGLVVTGLFIFLIVLGVSQGDSGYYTDYS